MSRRSSVSRASSAPRSRFSASTPALAVSAVSLVIAEPEHASLSSHSAAASLAPKQPRRAAGPPDLPAASPPDVAPMTPSDSSLASTSDTTGGPSGDAICANTATDNKSISVASLPDSARGPLQGQTAKKSWFGSRGRGTSTETRTSALTDTALAPSMSLSDGTMSSLPDQSSSSVNDSGKPPLDGSSPDADTAVSSAEDSSASSAPSRRSNSGWFGFRSGPVAASTVRQPVGQEDIAPDPQANISFPTLDAPEPVPSETQVSIPSLPRAIPPSRSGGWFSRGHALHPSIDDTVPTLSPHSPPRGPPEPATVRPRTRVDSNSLNPSASRFTLAIPLLGRPKVPLEQVLPKGDDVGEVEVAGNANEDAGNDVGVTEEARPPLPPSPPLPPPPARASWWEYVGLGAMSGNTVRNSQFTAPSVAPPVELPKAPISPSPQEMMEREEVPVSTDTTAAGHSSWRWYGFIPGASAQTPRKTEGELVKEAALAQQTLPESTLEGPPESQLPSNSRQQLEKSPSNPVLATLESRASWMSFFSSAAARSRVVTESGEMEVMYIGDEGGSAVTSAASVPPSARNPSPSSKNPPSPSPSTNDTPAQSKKMTLQPKKFSPASSRPVSPTPSDKAPVSPRTPNLVLPSFDDTFHAAPRCVPPVSAESTLRRILRRAFFSAEDEPARGPGEALPRLWDVLGMDTGTGKTTVRRVVVVGIHGWFPGALLRQVLGEPTGTSAKFASMMAVAVEAYFGVGVLEKLTQIALEGEGTIERRVNILYQEYCNHPEWVEDLQKADAILIATHSQGSIVSTQLIDLLIEEGHIRTHKTSSNGVAPQRVCCLAMCGIHLGPLRSLNTSSLVQPYIQYFESAAARELFEFQDSESQVAKVYVQALSRVLEHGTKFAYVASMNDQVVPIYSGSFTSATHPLLLRALYIDGEAYSSSDFLSNLLVLLFRIRNAGLEDSGLLTHLSEATAGSLSGVGHSTAYEEPATYALAVRFLFETSGVLGHAKLDVQPFTARAARNDYEIPWALRDVIANPDVANLFASEFAALRAAFDEWHPRTTILRELRRKLEPIRRLPKPRL